MDDMVIPANYVKQLELSSKNGVGKPPLTLSSTVQMELREHFDLHVSISQINRVRAALGVSNRRKHQQQEKKVLALRLLERLEHIPSA